MLNPPPPHNFVSGCLLRKLHPSYWLIGREDDSDEGPLVIVMLVDQLFLAFLSIFLLQWLLSNPNFYQQDPQMAIQVKVFTSRDGVRVFTFQSILPLKNTIKNKAVPLHKKCQLLSGTFKIQSHIYIPQAYCSYMWQR